MKKIIQILTILILFTQCIKEETIKPKKRIGVYGAGIGVTAHTIIKYPDFELYVEEFSDYHIGDIGAPSSIVSLNIKSIKEGGKFGLKTFPNSSFSNDTLSQSQLIEIYNVPFRIIFETFNWDADKSTDEVLVVDKGRFIVEKVE